MTNNIQNMYRFTNLQIANRTVMFNGLEMMYTFVYSDEQFELFEPNNSQTNYIQRVRDLVINKSLNDM